MTEFLEYITEQLEPWGGIRTGRMFGGHALYKNDLPIGLVFTDTLYLKVDDTNRRDYEVTDSQPFTYEKQGKTIVISNWEVPAHILEQPDDFIIWAQKSHQIALNLKKKKGNPQ